MENSRAHTQHGSVAGNALGRRCRGLLRAGLLTIPARSLTPGDGHLDHRPSARPPESATGPPTGHRPERLSGPPDRDCDTVRFEVVVHVTPRPGRRNHRTDPRRPCRRLPGPGRTRRRCRLHHPARTECVRRAWHHPAGLGGSRPQSPGQEWSRLRQVRFAVDASPTGWGTTAVAFTAASRRGDTLVAPGSAPFSQPLWHGRKIRRARWGRAARSSALRPHRVKACPDVRALSAGACLES